MWLFRLSYLICLVLLAKRMGAIFI
uniref:Uncharacterized protein n=1 Tax=Arundo donax TaxID=35708 RepID=A0A0A9EHY5_ARUDO